MWVDTLHLVTEGYADHALKFRCPFVKMIDTGRNKAYIPVTILMNRSFRNFGFSERETFLDDLAEISICARKDFKDINIWNGCVTCQIVLPAAPAERLVRLWELVTKEGWRFSQGIIEMKHFINKHWVTAIYSQFLAPVKNLSEEVIQPVVPNASDSVINPESDLPLEDDPNLNSLEVPYFSEDERVYLERQARLFKEKKPFILEKFQGLYVHFEDGRVLGASKDQAKLVEKAYKDGGMRPLFIKLVLAEEEAKPQLWTPFV